MEEFKAGDKVRCIISAGAFYIQDEGIYTVKRRCGDLYIELEEGPCGTYRSSRFELVENTEPTEKFPDKSPEITITGTLTLNYMGVTTNIHTSDPLSRKYAEAFLDVVYGEKK